MSGQVSPTSPENKVSRSSKQTAPHNSFDRIQRYLGVFGPKASGKTVYLTSLYNLSIFSQEDEATFHISTPDGHPTHRYLKQRWQQMTQHRQWVDATELSAPSELLFHVTWKDPQGSTRDYRIILPDACGELMARAEEYSKTQQSSFLQLQLKEDYLQQLTQSHGVAIFVPSNLVPRSQEAAELKHSFDPLFDALKRERDQQGIKQPIAVIVTMWDIHSPHPQGHVQEEEKARIYIRSVLGNFLEGLEQIASKDFVKVFPVSATGPLLPAHLMQIHHNQILPPPVQFHPFRLKAPIHWLLSSYEQLLLTHAERACEQAQLRPKLKQLSPLKRQLQEYLQEVAPSPEKDKLDALFDDISHLESTLQKKKRRRRWISGFSLIVIGVFVIIVWDLLFRAEALSKAEKLINDPKTTQMQRIHALHGLCSRRPFPTQVILGCWGSIDLKRQEVIKSGAAVAWKELLPLPPNPSLSQLQARVNDLETFVQTYPNVPETSLAKRQLADVKEQFTQKQQTEQRAAWNRFLEQAQQARSLDALGSLEANCRSLFLDKKEYAWMRLQIIDVCSKLRVKLEQQKSLSAVQQKLAEMKAKIAQDDQNTTLCIKETSDFLAQYPQTEYTEEVKKKQESCQKKADDNFWEKEVASYHRDNATEYENIVNRATKYLQQTEHKGHSQEAKELIEKTKNLWDRSIYKEIQSDWQNNLAKLDGMIIDRIQKRCEAYITHAPTKQMSGAVQSWLRWNKKLRSGIQFNLTIEGIYIGKAWYSRLHWPDVVVYVKIGDIEQKSQEMVDLVVETQYRANEDNHLVTKKQLPQTLGPFTWRYGIDDITIRMLNTEVSLSQEQTWKVSDAQYNISVLQGKLCVQPEFCLHVRTEPISQEDRVPDNTIFPDYND